MLAVGEDAHADAPAACRTAPGSRRAGGTYSGLGSRPPREPMLRLNSMKVSRAVRSTARREPRAGGFSSTTSLVRTRQVATRKSRTAVVMFASASLFFVASENLGGGVPDVGVVVVYVWRHCWVLSNWRGVDATGGVDGGGWGGEVGWEGLHPHPNLPP